MSLTLLKPGRKLGGEDGFLVGMSFLTFKKLDLLNSLLSRLPRDARNGIPHQKGIQLKHPWWECHS